MPAKTDWKRINAQRSLDGKTARNRLKATKRKGLASLCSTKSNLETWQFPGYSLQSPSTVHAVPEGKRPPVKYPLLDRPDQDQDPDQDQHPSINQTSVTSLSPFCNPFSRSLWHKIRQKIQPSSSLSTGYHPLVDTLFWLLLGGDLLFSLLLPYFCSSLCWLVSFHLVAVPLHDLSRVRSALLNDANVYLTIINRRR